MKISVHLMPSNPALHGPGHMAVSWEEEGQEVSFRGYVFKMEDLPRAYRAPQQWRQYLFDHAVPGYVIEDIEMRAKVESASPGLLTQSWPGTASHAEKARLLGATGRNGTYSFNPDDHPGAHNCVTWATNLLNTVLGEVLPKVRQGRIKLMTEVLRSFDSHHPS